MSTWCSPLLGVPNPFPALVPPSSYGLGPVPGWTRPKFGAKSNLKVVRQGQESKTVFRPGLL